MKDSRLRHSHRTGGKRRTAARSSWRSLGCVFALTIAVALPASSVLAHHSVSQFDSTAEKVLEGTVRKMEWANPHVWIRLNVEDEEGNVVEWSVEASNPLDLGRKGWTKKTFQEGDRVKITVHPAKNDKPYGAFIKATLADGKELTGP